MNSKNEKKKNIEKLIEIRDGADTLAAVKVQAIQTMQKLIAEDDPEAHRNLEVLKQIRDDKSVSRAVCIQAIQTMHKIFDPADGEADSNQVTEADIMAKIRKGLK